MSVTTLLPLAPFSNYMALLSDLVAKSDTVRKDRTGVGTASIFGRQLTFDLNASFPLLPFRPVSLMDVARELVWFLEGSTDNNRLNALGSKIWNQWALPENHSTKFTMNPYDRAIHYAHQSGKTLDAVISKLQSMGDMDIGHKFLDEQQVPRELEQVIVAAGSIGPSYGAQWRSWRNVTMQPDGSVQRADVDQLVKLIHDLEHNPYSRRHILTAWNPAYLPDEKLSPLDNIRQGKMAIAPCHHMCQFYVSDLSTQERVAVLNAHLDDDSMAIDYWAWADEPEHLDELDKKLDELGVPIRGLSAKLSQRSADIQLGVPYNIASYALFVHLLCAKLGYAPQELIISFGDVHLYSNHVDAANELLQRYQDYVSNGNDAYQLTPQFFMPDNMDITSFMGKKNEFGEVQLVDVEAVRSNLAVLVQGLVGYVPYPKLDSPMPIAV
jgi:thymidylate synthase